MRTMSKSQWNYCVQPDATNTLLIPNKSYKFFCIHHPLSYFIHTIFCQLKQTYVHHVYFYHLICPLFSSDWDIWLGDFQEWKISHQTKIRCSNEKRIEPKYTVWIQNSIRDSSQVALEKKLVYPSSYFGIP